ncbi:ribonuclease III [Devriesea agamarum]|uniref:ribonuclease III n=1 Tax=Devriesea agamarum TaxID=472569 RepID=UPI00071C8732|nr:ribonuclease III [Devriesea agamarum]
MARRRHVDASPASPDGLLARIGLPLDRDLLDLALTHRSYAFENGGLPHNERLEFLGDAVLGLAAAEKLYEMFPDLPEGQLARRRAAIVNMRALAGIARTIELGQYIRLGRGEFLDGGRDKASILADTTEALIGAVHVGLGAEVSRTFVLDLLAPLLADETALDAGFDYKTRLQEIAAETGDVPRYEITEHGPEHAKRYVAKVQVVGRVTGSGEGRSKKDAEQAAAEAAVRAVSSARGINPVS